MLDFETLEREIFRYACNEARRVAGEILQSFDQELFERRNKNKYMVIGAKKTVVKTLFGEVAYTRRRYKKILPDGSGESMYLLDHVLGIHSVGNISDTLAKLIAISATRQSYRRAAEAVSDMTGQVISHTAVWNVIQALGSEVRDREKIAVRRLKDDMLQGLDETPVLFEEADGVYISIQGRDRKRFKKRRQEMKVSLAYSGWIRDGKKMRLKGKVATAGFHPVGEFHKIREAAIRRKYNTDEIKLRLLNGDGASWVRNIYDPDTVYQLDRFHIEQEITRCIRHKKACKGIRKLLHSGRISACLKYIETYRDSVSGKDSENAEKLLDYLRNNRDGLIPYKDRGLNIPEPPEGIEYRNMGTQENHNFTIITARMKNNRTSWSLDGATNMAKVLTEIENNTLEMTVQKYFERTQSENLMSVHEVAKEKISVCQTPKTEGHGDEAKTVHMLLKDWQRSPSLDFLLRNLDIETVLN